MGGTGARTSDPQLVELVLSQVRPRPVELPNGILRGPAYGNSPLVASVGDSCAYGARKDRPPAGSIRCSSSQPQNAAFTALFSQTKPAAPRSAGLLIPRSQVRALSGPYDFQEFLCGSRCRTYVCLYAQLACAAAAAQFVAASHVLVAARCSSCNGILRPLRRQAIGTELGSNGVGLEPVTPSLSNAPGTSPRCAGWGELRALKPFRHPHVCHPARWSATIPFRDLSAGVSKKSVSAPVRTTSANPATAAALPRRSAVLRDASQVVWSFRFGEPPSPH
jgi:hypothetical protein